ncbi:hypothetical protein O2K51_03070 [Apibacter raozihei]|uniref:hypothetical protein n=1 Tax=Apibacter raozihei TaxID=2500547 RepID=UPI000FE3D60B|nr:hypothetical protein [Apibacter raozihei]
MLLDHIYLKITKSDSKLSFTTTGGGDWEVWDRFISYDNEPLFHIGNICGTCAFFFTQIKTDLAGSYTADSVRNNLANGIETISDDISKQLSAIIPEGEYECLLLEIQPYQTCYNGKRDYFKEEQNPLWDYEDETDETGGIYYRGTDSVISEHEKLFEFFIPLYPPSSLEENRVRFYQEQIREGKQPTALALAVVDAKECMTYMEIPEDGIVSHWTYANYLLDGHHKIQAASREKKSITLLSFISKDASFKVVDTLVELYKKNN